MIDEDKNGNQTNNYIGSIIKPVSKKQPLAKEQSQNQMLSLSASDLGKLNID